MRKLKLFSALLLTAFLSIGQVWGETATITFANQTSGTSDGSTAYTTSTIISSGIASSDAAFGTITCSATDKCYSGKINMGMKAGAKSSAGSFTFSFTALPNVSKITLNRAAYNDSKAATITVKNGTTTLGSASTGTTTTLNDMDINNLNIASLSSLTVESDKYCYIKSITITYTPAAVKTLSSISVKTAPTKTEYTEGDYFDPTGLVITATYSDASTSDVAYKDNEDKFSFSPALNEALETTDAQVTITYGEKSANQAITVNAAAPCTSEIKITKGTPEHGSFDLTGAGTVCIDGGNASATVSNIEAADGYRFKEITTDAGTVDGMDITDIDANTTINVVFEEIPSHKVFFYNGSTLLNEGGTDVKEGAAVAYSGSTPESCDSGEGASTNFAGWATDVWDGKVAKANIVPDFYDGALPVMGENDVTYYAVFCKGGNAVGGITQEEIANNVAKQEDNTGNYASRTFASESGDWTGTFAHNVQIEQKVMQITNTSGRSIISPTFSGTISKIEITFTNGSSSNDRSFSLTNGTDNIGSIAAPHSSKGVTDHADISGSYTSFVITAPDGALYIHSIRVTYGTEASNFMTSCCEPLDEIGGSVKSVNQNSVTLQWTKLENVDGTTPYEVEVSPSTGILVGAINLEGEKAECAITKLACGTEYTFTIKANGATGYCDAEQEIIQSTSKYTITTSAVGGGLVLSPDVTAACVGDEITLTANTPDGSHEGVGDIVVTDGEENDVTSSVLDGSTLTMPAYDITITATYAEKTSPSVGVTPAALDFESPKKGDVIAPKTFELTGSALEAGTLILVAPSGYSVSPSEIEVAAGSLAATEITVTPSTAKAGEFNGNISISGAGVSSTNIVALTMTVQETYTVSWYVNGQSVKTQTAVSGTDLEAFPTDFSAFTDCSELSFRGWLNAPLDEASATAPEGLITETEGLKMPEGNVNYYAVFATQGGTPAVKVVDNIDPTFVGKPSSYGNWSGKVGTSGAVYAGNSQGGAAYIQIRSNNSNSGIVTTNTGAGKITKVTVTWNSGTAATRTLDIYGKNTAYESAADLYDSATQGTELGSLNIDNAIDGVSTLVVEGDYTFIGMRSNSGAMYIDNIAIEWTTPAAYTYSNFVTTCPSCENIVTFAKAGEGNGCSFELQVSGVAKESVKTCDDAVTVNIVESLATGYELSEVAISELSGASLDGKVITIAQNTNGPLTVTATFSAIDYEVALSQTGDAEAELTGAKNDAHYGESITVSAEDKAGFYFLGWEATGVTLTDASTLSQTFNMPNNDVALTAKYTKVLTVAEAKELNVDDNVIVDGIVSEIQSLDPSKWKRAQYFISDDGKTDEQFLVYNGYYVGGADFTDLNQLKVGDKVRVSGTIGYYTSKQIAQNSIMLSSTHLSSVAISGTCQNEYEAGDAFDRTGLVATAKWEDNSERVVTGDAVWTNNLTDNKIQTAGDVNVTATWCEMAGSKVVAVTLLTHEVIFADPANGSIVVKANGTPIETGEHLVKGDVITVEATPASGYQLASLTAETTSGSTDIKESKSFTIDEEDVEIVASFTFATAIDNTEASEKVVKTMENGVLIIRRGDKTYNGQGQLIK